MFNCEVCDSKYNSVSGYNKHLRTKHKDIPKKITVKSNIYFCNNCDESFDLKANLIKHVKTHLTEKFNMICSFTNCTKSFYSMTGLISHLKSHNINIESTLLNFNTIEGKFIYNYILKLLTITINFLCFMYSCSFQTTFCL